MNRSSLGSSTVLIRAGQQSYGVNGDALVLMLVGGDKARKTRPLMRDTKPFDHFYLHVSLCQIFLTIGRKFIH